MKKLVLSLLSVTLVLALSGCGPASSSKESTDTAKNASAKPQNQVQQSTQQQPTQPAQNKGTNSNPASKGTSNVTPASTNAGTSNQNNATNTTQQKPPHAYGEFQGAGKTFTGGSNAVKDYNLIGFRRAPHPSFSRIIFDFGIGASGTTQAVDAPAYVVSMDATGKKVTLELNGVNWSQADNQAAQVSSIAPLINKMSITHPAPQKLKVVMSLNSPSVFQVFDLPNPARIAVVMAPKGN